MFAQQSRKPVLNYCTYFDSHYLSRGLAMIRSLRMADPTCRIFVLCLDEACCRILQGMRLAGVILVRLAEFEDPELLQAKKNRTLVEYYWTCTPSWILYCLRHFNLDRCTYVDADVFFFSNPQPLVEESGNNSALITEHRFSPAYAEYAVNGIYNVQFMTFRADPRGWEILEWWRSACNQWCYYRLEDGKLGDQKYLDDWPQRFAGVHVLRHPGGAIGPWNVQQYEFQAQDPLNPNLRAVLRKSGTEFPVIFYHFHNFRLFPGGYAKAIFYEISNQAWKQLYQPYTKALLKADQEVRDHTKEILSGGLESQDESVPSVLLGLREKKDLTQRYLVFDWNRFRRFAGWKAWICRVQSPQVFVF